MSVDQSTPPAQNSPAPLNAATQAQESFRPGKIIAIHLSYESRAHQRGRKPAHPSYFFKPSSSLGASGDTVERPHGAELLAFEGEIALIVGSPIRHVSPDAAWSHISSITAANDLGIYDYRAQDKGSNVRSKGRDGYTPVGPNLIDASSIDPTQIRVRTWVNSELRQDDSTAHLIFSLTSIIADLSQHMTLHPGDIILAGTPAGSSVINPGDTVEVEVDVPTAPHHPSSGKLRTTVTQGTTEFDPDIGDLPQVDDKQREEAWGSAEAAGFTQPATQTPTGLSESLRAKLLAVPTAGLSAQMRKRGLNACSVAGVAAAHPDTKLVGVAKTLRFVPGREDLFKSHGGGYNAQKRAFDEVAPGEVIVIEARGETGSGTLGDILALRAQARGAAGVVTDGGVRDYQAVAKIGLPVFSNGPHPAVLGRKHVPWDVDLTIACGGATVQPGDIIVGDSDGVIVLPPHLAEEVADAALTQEDEDAWIATHVQAGHELDGLFPMNAQWRQRYDDAQSTPPSTPAP